MNTEIQARKNLFTLLHVVGWIIVLILPLYFYNSEWARNSSFEGRYYVTAVIYGIVFYLNYFYLVPRLFFRKNRVYYFLINAVIIIALFYVEGYANRHLFQSTPIELKVQEMFRKFNAENNLTSPPFRQLHLLNFILMNILIAGFAVGLRITEKYVSQEKQQKELEKLRLSTELAFLKSQVGPHFFFNTLNNIYSLIGINTSDAQKAVLKLSKLMRYLLYESEQGRVSLEKEIEFMNHYIDLMKLRLSNKVDLRIEFPDNANGLTIPPLLFIPFIENAFKHGISYKENSYIHLGLNIGERQIRFECLNSLVTHGESSKDTTQGIGLDNVKKRLALLFPGTHELKLDRSDTSFQVDLKIWDLWDKP